MEVNQDNTKPALNELQNEESENVFYKGSLHFAALEILNML